MDNRPPRRPYPGGQQPPGDWRGRATPPPGRPTHHPRGARPGRGGPPPDDAPTHPARPVPPRPTERSEPGRGPQAPHRPRDPRGRRGIARGWRGAKVALVLVSALILSLTGYAWATLEELRDGMTLADVIGEGGGEKPADGAVDILLVGMDSRTDAQGNPLPKKVLSALRAGSADGELNTDTLIQVHIPNNGKKATAISMPRDSYVNIPGYGQHKINSAYVRAKYDERARLQEEEGVTKKSELEVRSNQEGAKTLIETVEGLTGSTIDHYAEVNLLGFSEITKAVGGVEVCLKEPVQDEFSGANFPAGKQTISGAKALAFVRQRHGLLRGDVDRIVRQQVFMAGLAKKMLSAGTLADQDKLEELLNAVKRSVVLDQDWSIIDFASQMRGLSAGQINFQTIPIQDMELETGDGQAIGVDPVQVQQFVQNLSGDGAKKHRGKQAGTRQENSSITVNVFNAAGVTDLAANVSQQLTNKGFGTGETGNAEPREDTVVRHAIGEQASAQRVVDALGGNAVPEPDANLQPGQVSVLLGASYQGPDQLAGDKRLRLNSPKPAQAPPGGNPPITADGIPCVN